jgi:hypothetical protein
MILTSGVFAGLSIYVSILTNVGLDGHGKKYASADQSVRACL